MRHKLVRLLASSIAILLVGCATTTPTFSVSQPAAVAGKSQGLSEQILYDILVGELAQQEGDLNRAINHYLIAAQRSQDARVAERAARLALRLDSHPRALDAARLWVALNPEDLEAHQAAATFYLRESNGPQAFLHLKFLLEKVEKRRKGAGFLLVTNILRREENKKLSLSVVKQLTSSYGDEPEALFSHAVIARAAERYESAAELASRAIGRRPDWPGAWALYLQTMAAQGKLDPALKEFRETIEKYPENTRLRVVLARSLIEQQRYEEANREYGEVLKLSPNDAEVIYPLALLALNARQEDIAKEYLLRLIELKHRLHEVRFYLGQLEESARNYSEAATLYRQVKGDQFGIEARIRLAVVAAKQGEIQRARAQLQQLRSERRNLSIRLYLAEGEVLREAGEFLLQMEVLDSALEEHPGDSDLLYARALTAEKIDRVDWLERDLRTILDKDPDNAAALNALGYTLADRTLRYKEAMEYISRAYQIDPDDPAIIDSMGWVLYRLGRLEEAIKHLRRALAMGKDAEIAAHLGEVLWKAGQRNEAEAVWRKALQQDPNAAVVQKTMQRLRQ